MLAGIACFFVLGAFTWSFLEYVIHRWLGHDRRFRKNAFSREHIRHHVEGNYFAATWKKVVLAALAAALLVSPAVFALGPPRGIAFVAGLVLFYGAYELLHRREHTHAGFGPYARWARRHHFHHHFVNARVNHGVTSPLWDLVFGTYSPPGVIRVPARLCLSWLRDPATGDVRADYKDVFVIEP